MGPETQLVRTKSEENVVQLLATLYPCLGLHTNNHTKWGLYIIYLQFRLFLYFENINLTQLSRSCL